MVHLIIENAKQRYNQSEKGRASRRRYRQSAKGRAAAKRYRDKRRAGWLQLRTEMRLRQQSEHRVLEDGTIQPL